MYSKYLHKLTYPNSFAKARSGGIYSKALSILIVFYKHCMLTTRNSVPMEFAMADNSPSFQSNESEHDRARCIEHNLKAIDISIPKKLHGFHRDVRRRKVVPRLRHHLRGGSAAVCEFVRLCAPIPRPDGEAKIRLDSWTRSTISRAENGEQEPRSTVGTITEIHDYMRVLFARLGHQHCHQCGRSVKPQSAGKSSTN